MIYINNYNSINEAVAATDAMSPNLSYVLGSTNGIVYTNVGEDKPIKFVNDNGTVKGEEKSGLRFTAQQDNSTVRLKKNGTLNTSYEYSTDNENWNSYTIGDVITLANIGDKVYFRGDNGKVTFHWSAYMQFEMTGLIAAGGNIMSLLDKTMELGSVPTYSFYSLFYNCRSLTSAPELPAMTLSSYSYDSLFLGCTSLTTAPVLPALSLNEYCYSGMFYGCTSLTTGPILPATTLVQYCYDSMFLGCTSLTSLTVYADDISASNCISNWLMNVNTTGILYAYGSADFTGNVPNSWTISTTPPAN